MANIVFVTDFDGTLTQKDTSYLSFHSTSEYINSTDNEKEKLNQHWNERSTEYYSGFKKLLEQQLNAYKSSNECDLKELFKLLVCLDEYSLESRKGLARRNYFNNIVTTNLDGLVEQIKFYPNAMNALLKFKDVLKTPPKVLSINWFPQLLQHALKGFIKETDVLTSIPPVLKFGTENDNDDKVDFGEVSTSMDKRSWIEKCSNENVNSTIVYIGDSITDLAALLEANYGILFGGHKQASDAALTFGIRLIPLKDIIKSKEGHDYKTIYLSTDWNEVETFVLSLV